MHTVSFILLIVGGINWLLYGLFEAELGTWLGGMDSWLWRIIYILVGLAAVYELFSHKKTCKMCEKGMGAKTGQGGQTM